MTKLNRVLTRTAAAILSLAAVCMVITSAASALITEADIRSYGDRLAEVAQKKAEAEEILAEIQKNQARAYEQIAQFDQILELNDEMRRLTEEQIGALGNQIEETRQAIADTELSIERQKQTLLNRMRENYMDSRTDYLEVLLSSSTLFDFLKKLDYVDAVLNYDQRLIRQMGEDGERLAEYEDLLLKAEEEQKQRLEELNARIDEYRAAEEEKYEYIVSLEANEQWWTDNYAYNKDLEDTLNRELEATLVRLEEQRRQEAEAARQAAELERQKEEAARLYEEQDTYYGEVNES